MSRKIIFLDVDGTLVDYDNRIPESAIQAIRQARENGHLIYVCTGRSKAEMPQEIWDIGLDGMIGGNGSYVEHEGQVIMHQLIPLEVEKRVVDWLHERGLEFYLESNNSLFASEHFRDAARPVMKLYAKKKGKTDIDRQFEYNTYIRAFFEDNQGKSLEEAIMCWKYKKSLQGHNRYEKSDLIALENKNRKSGK